MQGGGWPAKEPAPARTSGSGPSSKIRTYHPTGYEIAEGQPVIAAVETINQGRVWISPSLSRDEKDRAAVIAAALVLSKNRVLAIFVEPRPLLASRFGRSRSLR
jgi:hypothetical protein